MLQPVEPMNDNTSIFSGQQNAIERVRFKIVTARFWAG